MCIEELFDTFNLGCVEWVEAGPKIMPVLRGLRLRPMPLQCWTKVGVCEHGGNTKQNQFTSLFPGNRGCGSEHSDESGTDPSNKSGPDPSDNTGYCSKTFSVNKV